MKKELLNAIWTFVGVTVGAGILSLPYVFSKSGFYTGLLVMSITAVIILIISLYLGEVVLRTKGKHQLSGLAEKYLGKKSKIIMFIANTLSIYGALAAYVIGSSQALASIFGGNTVLYSIILFIVLATTIYFGINILEGFEAIFTPVKIIVSIILSLLLFKFINFSNISGFSFYNILIPYGVSIFAFTGISAIPEMNEELKNKKYLFKAIIIGMIITFLIYLLFIFSTVGSLGKVGEVATVSLSKLSFGINIFANLFAIFAMSTAFVVLGFALKENLTLDFKVKNFPSWLMVTLIPFILVLTGFFGFARLIELSGAIALGIIFMMILIMHSKAKKFGDRKPEYNLSDNKLVKIILFVILIIGIIHAIGGI